MRSILRGLTGGNAGGAEAEPYFDASAIGPADAARRLQILDDFEQAGIGWIWATDPECRLMYLSANAGEKLGRPAAELLGHPLTALFETDPDNPDEKSDRPLNFQLNARSKLHDLVVRVALDRPRGEGRDVWWSISAHPRFDQANRFVGYRGSAKDVTVEYERKLIDLRMAEYDLADRAGQPPPHEPAARSRSSARSGSRAAPAR